MMSFFVDSIIDIKCCHLLEQFVAGCVAIRLERFRMAAVGDYGVPVGLRFLLCFVVHHKKFGVGGWRGVMGSMML